MSDRQTGHPIVMLWIIRGFFVLAVAGAAAAMASAYAYPPDPKPATPPSSRVTTLIFLSGVAIAVIAVVLDIRFRIKQIATISAIFFGLIVGLILGQLFQIAARDMLESLGVPPGLRYSLFLIATLVTCYVCITVLVQTRDQFRFVIPYVEFSRVVKGFKPLVLDTSVIIDGRIADVCDTRILDAPLVIPRFVLNELQAVADSSDKLRRNRGRRGLDMLNKLRANKSVEIQMHDGDLPELAGQRVDQQVVLLAKALGGKVVTNDFNLNKMAKVQGVDVINLNDLANALKPVVLPGEAMTVKIVKVGEEVGQGVGYLDDGTMVVVEGGRGQIGQLVAIAVTSVLQTSAGRMIFGRLEGVPKPVEK